VAQIAAELREKCSLGGYLLDCVVYTDARVFQAELRRADLRRAACQAKLDERGWRLLKSRNPPISPAGGLR